MRVTSIDIHASNSNKALTLSFRDPRSNSQYIAKAILGLDAEDIMSKFSSVGPWSMKKYYELTLLKRDVVIQIALNPNARQGESFGTLRDNLYRVISASRTGVIEFRFKDGDRVVAAVSGFVTKLESPQFERSPEAHLTIRCEDPMLKALEPVNVNVNGFTPALATISDEESTAPHGLRLGVKFSKHSVEFAIQDGPDPTAIFEVNLAGSVLDRFTPGDELHFSSEHNNRYVYLIRNFEIFHLVDRIVPTSIWPVIFPGDNDFTCSDAAIWDYATYYPTYWGV